MTYRKTTLVLAVGTFLATFSILNGQEATAPVSTPATAPATQPLPTAQEVLDRYIEATGGKAAYESITSRHVEADFVMADLGIKGKFVGDFRKDGKAITRTELPNVDTFYLGVNDGIVWRNDQTSGPRVLEGTMASAMLEALKLTPEISLDAFKSAKVSDLTEIDGVSVYKLELEYKDFDAVETRYYDAKSGLLLRSSSTLPTEQGNIAVTTRYLDYEDVAPIRIPMKTRQSMAGLSPEQINTKVEHNVEIADEVFALPPEVQDLLKRRAATQPAK